MHKYNVEAAFSNSLIILLNLFIFVKYFYVAFRAFIYTMIKELRVQTQFPLAER